MGRAEDLPQNWDRHFFLGRPRKIRPFWKLAYLPRIQRFDNAELFCIKCGYSEGWMKWISWSFCIWFYIAEHKDIIFADMIDSYHNLTLKVLHGLTWAKRHCTNFNFLVKVDSDVFLNPFSLVDYFYLHNLFSKPDTEFVGRSWSDSVAVLSTEPMLIHEGISIIHWSLNLHFHSFSIPSFPNPRFPQAVPSVPIAYLEGHSTTNGRYRFSFILTPFIRTTLTVLATSCRVKQPPNSFLPSLTSAWFHSRTFISPASWLECILRLQEPRWRATWATMAGWLTIKSNTPRNLYHRTSTVWIKSKNGGLTLFNSGRTIIF